MSPSVSSELYGKHKDGQNITRYTLSNSKGMSVQVINYGGIVSSINVPDKNGKVEDVALGFDSLQEWEKDELFFGAIVGRVANRIAGGQFTVDGKTYQLCVNNGPNSLHGGKEGYYKRVWQSSVKDGKVELVYVSPDGEENYPGELTLTVVYSLDDDNVLSIDYHATSTKATPVNFTNHSYFNLGGQACGQIEDHLVTLNAEAYLPTDDTNIPTGELRKVSGTEFDLLTPVRLGDRLGNVPGGCGFDHCYSLSNDNGEFKKAARVEHPPSGRYMECHTTEPGLQLYTGYYINDVKGKGGSVYGQYSGFCLEAQHYPDSVHQPSFPNCVLRPGEVYKQKTAYKFGVL